LLASRIWEAAWTISEKHLQTRQGVYLLCCRGDLERQRANLVAARAYFERALSSAQDAYIPGWIGHCYLGRAELALAEGDLTSSEFDLKQARSFYETLGQRWGLLQVGIGDVRIRLLRDDPTWESLAVATLEDASNLGYKRDEAFLRTLLATRHHAANCLMFV
jgi:hypothetical protein